MMRSLEAVLRRGGRGSCRAWIRRIRGSAGAAPSRMTVLKCVLVIVAASVVWTNVSASTHAAELSWQTEMLKLRSKCIAAESTSNDALTQPSLKEEAIRLFAAFPRESDWFMQDADRMSEAPVGADLNRECVPKNLSTFCYGKRSTEFEQQLIRRVLGELHHPAPLQRELERLIESGASMNDRCWLDLYIQACELRRLQRLADLKRSFPRILFIKRHMLQPSFFAYTEGLSDAHAERNFIPGSSLCLLQWEDDQPRVTELIQDPDGILRDLDVSWDGQRILFAWKKSDRDDDYHLYEMLWPERQIRQLTFGLGVADYEGRYLPNDDLIFTSSRCVSTVDCWVCEVSNLYTCDKDGKYLRRLGFDQVHTIYPSVLDDGTVIYTRWDYNDRGQVYPQPLFRMNPDGTGQSEYYGNNSWFPTTINHARGIPGTNQVLAVLHGHHTWQAGVLAIIDRSKGTQEASGVQLIAPIRETAAVQVDQYGQDGNLHRHPYPLTKNSFLVAMTPYWNARHEGGRYNLWFHLYWMDVDGHRELLVHDPSISCGHPIPLAPRKRPYIQTSNVDYRKPYGTYFLQDIYAGPGLEGVDRGSVKKLRVVTLEFRALHVGKNISKGPAGGAMSSTPVSTGNGCWDVKKILGEATVYEDGSALFQVPANTPVYFQAIDERGSMVQTMRSWSTLMPNEYFGCVGCHEQPGETPQATRDTLAMQAGVEQLTPFYGPPRGFSFVEEIQPILNKHCIRCHDGKTTSPETGKVLSDLTDQRYLDPVSKRQWTVSYLNLTHSPLEPSVAGDADHPVLNWMSAQSVPTRLPPYFRGSAQSEIIAQLRNEHGDAQLTREELDKFSAWIDLGVPFCGDYQENNAWTEEERKKYNQMERKRARLESEVQENVRALIESQLDPRSPQAAVMQSP